MQLNRKSNKLIITGSAGTGKSSFFNDYILNSAYEFKFIYDPEGEFQIRNPKLFNHVVYDINAIPDTIDEKKGGLVIFDPCKLGDLEEGFAMFSETVFAICEHLPYEKLFASDELQLSNAVSNIPEGFSRILEVGRRRGLDAAFIVQGINLAHNRLRNQATSIVTFRQKSIPAMKYLENEFGLAEVSDRVQMLKDGEFIERNLKTGDLYSGDFFKKMLTQI